ncbi:hypothetical protein, partial [Salmonella enterica]
KQVIYELQAVCYPYLSGRQQFLSVPGSIYPVLLQHWPITPSADAARDKYAHFREINSTAAMFQYLQKNYNPTDSSFL